MKTIDCVMLSWSKNDELKKMTQAAIDSLHVSSTEYKFDIHLIETCTEPVMYTGAKITQPGIPFNYNQYLNIGLAKCRSEYVIIANNDLIFHPGWFEAIIASGADSASPVSPGWKPHEDKIDKTTFGYRTSIELTGWCLVVKKAVLDRIGPFDPTFELMYQDNDYAQNLRKHRIIHALVGSAKVTHLVAKTHDGYHSKAIRRQMRKAEALFNGKWGNQTSTACLTMIVKDESKVILEALSSVYKFVDYWVIVDTGSTDNTKEIITNFFKEKGIPGELHDRKWVNFGHNRTEALQLADGKADYMVMMDADDIISGNVNFRNLKEDCYSVKHGSNFNYWRIQIFRSGLRWIYKGVLHEAPFSDVAKSVGRLSGDYQWISRTVGARNNDPLKYAKDAQTLEEAIKTEPDNARYWFYLGQSYFDAGDFANAKRGYAKRVALGGWPEETYYAQYRIGICDIRLESPMEQVIASMLKASEMKPDRAENLCSLSAYLRSKGFHAMAYPFALAATQIRRPVNDILFVHEDVYEYQALDELAVCSFYVGKRAESIQICNILLTKKLPEEYKQRIEKNKALCEKAIAGTKGAQ